MFILTTVVNKKKEEYDIYIGRGSIWGNPFHIGKDGTREIVINKYKSYFYHKIHRDESFRLETLKLKGKRLGCFCKPQACHGDVIKEYIESLSLPFAITSERASR